MQRPGGGGHEISLTFTVASQRLGPQTTILMPGFAAFIHDFLRITGKPGGTVRRDSNKACQAGPEPANRGGCPACFPGVLAQNSDREIGGGGATRQPGQVRKEAALTRSGSGRSSVSYLFCRRIAHVLRPIPPGGCSAKCLFRKASFERHSIADRSMNDAGAPLTPGDPE